MTAVMVCGGTAGHINPALSVAAKIREKFPESKIYFIGADRELEKRLVPAAGYELFNMKMTGVRRGFKPADILYNVKTVLYTFVAERKSKKLLTQLKPDFVFGTGGYICYPVMKKALKMGIPTYAHESNAVPGMVIRLLSRSLNKIFVTYEGSKSNYSNPEKVFCTGMPIRAEFAEILDESHMDRAKISDEKPLVVSFWGSLGSSKMNDLMPEIIKRNLEEKCFHHIHSAGGNIKELIDKLSELGVEDTSQPYADIREYISDMPGVLTQASLVVCRAGGSTLAELTATFKPALLVPSPYVVDNQQIENAKLLEKTGAVVTIAERDCTSERLFSEIKFLLSDADKLKTMEIAQKSMYNGDASEKILDIILQELKLC
ncbi:MAG: UDP-N-acetylglucosamine--N-acetylmuramyl-(pentapeptide) pyrophosphoryl-undecaprenol N-acetylglucosamine transferase [Oscillospiraceae bacterium]|nr:UDP-N-acetylglucosamine--N-acetylmuramyl-(pentapeptide) pyrophosphoryl-undecaprenol N-acetylglucosamine transferase [Oscillospiraceae bacterium]